jgi:tRNA(Ile)-lysidine synthase
LRSLGQEHREDATNADRRFTRNRIRHDLLPRLAEYNPRLVDVLGRLAGQAADWQPELDAVADALLRVAEQPRAGAVVVLDRATLAAAPPHRLRLLWRRVWEREGWPRQEMGYDEWDRLAALCHDGPTVLDLPGGVWARRRAGVVLVGPTDRGSNA